MREAVIVEAVRTPMGRHGGIFKDVRTDDLAAFIIAKLVEKTGINKEEIEDVYFGCTNQAGEDNRNVARMAALLAGLPYSVPEGRRSTACAVPASKRSIKRDAPWKPITVIFLSPAASEHDPRYLGNGQAGQRVPARQRANVRQLARLALSQQAHGRALLADQQRRDGGKRRG